MTPPERLSASRIDLGRPDADDRSTREGAPAAGPLLFLPFMALFVVGLWLLGYGFEQGSGLIFGLGLLVAGIAFMVPLTLRD
jgi:hypothetical protein